MKAKKRIFWWLERAGVLVILLFNLFPIYWILTTAFKREIDAFSTSFLFTPTLANFQAVFGPIVGVGKNFVNSIIVSVITVAITVPLGVMAAYVFSRRNFKFRKFILMYILITQFIPPIIMTMPYFRAYQLLGLMDTYAGLVIISLTHTLPYSIWMAKGFVDAMPYEVEEAAFIDGCGQLKVLTKVVAPLMMPGIITTAAMTFIMSWNEYMFPLILTRGKAVTLPLALMKSVTNDGVLWNWMSAMGVLVMIPVLVISFAIRKHFVQGITMGSDK